MMTQGIGLCGAHRTGKTTLAREYAIRNNVSFLEMKTTNVFKDLGLDPKVEYDFETRLTIQNSILAKMEYLLNSVEGAFISDRTPIDVLAYTLADVQRSNLTPEQSMAVMRHFEACVKLTNKFYSCLIVVQPAIPIVEAEGKAPAIPAYMEHLNSLILGLVIHEKVFCSHFYIPKRIISLSERLHSVDAAVEKTNSRKVMILGKATESEVCFH
jgi:hypothetical protein